MMAVIDKIKTTFITEWGTYYYKVMPFGLKNVEATYQRAATALFHDMMHKEVEVYVDNMMVKLEMQEGHFEASDKFLARLEKYNLRLNPKKYVFGVTSGKLLGHTTRICQFSDGNQRRNFSSQNSDGLTMDFSSQ